jgi:hypothetical protein
MATSTLEANNTGSDTIIAGYFHTGEDAHRAINALLNEGFLPSQIGAAFHTAGGSSELSTGTSSVSQPTVGTFNEKAADIDISAGGPSSGSDAVQPVGLSSGTGSPILGAGKPGPISGSNLSHTGLPHELQSELSHEQPGTRTAPAPVAVSTTRPTHTIHDHKSWTSKLKHLFESKHDNAPTTANPDSQKFGTGEGELDLTRPYSQTAFESSVSGAGVPAEHSRHLSHHLSTGGAVVTVSSTGRAVDVEKIFEQHNGVVRFSSDIFNDAPALDYEPRVEVFGHLEHRYPVL